MKKILIKGTEYPIDETSETPMMQQLNAQGLDIIAACNGAGICQTCAFKPVQGEFSPKTDNETFMDLPDGQRLSCQCKPLTDGEIEMIY